MIDVFVDLSAHDAASYTFQNLIAQWARPENLGGVARRVTVVPPAGTPTDDVRLPQGWVFIESASPLPALGAALDAAGRDALALLVLLGAVDVSNEAVGVLHQCLERDPMFGFALPRMSCADRCCFARLSRHGVGKTGWLPRKILAELPDHEILVEAVAPCLLIGSQVAGNFGLAGRQFEGVAAALLHFMAGARRCGFRTVLCNRAVAGVPHVTCDDPLEGVPDLSATDVALLDQLMPEFERSWQDYRGGSWERFEELCTVRADVARTPTRLSLLIDLRNVGPTFNGTTQAALGTLNALKIDPRNWDVTILANPEGAIFHDLERIHDGWPVCTTVPDQPFTVALRPTQPWHIQEMIDLHRAALVNVYMMLDTIAWDIAVMSPFLDGAWQFLAGHADAFLFDSEFTRRRFVERFPAGESVPGLVTHFSFDSTEYVRADVQAQEDSTEFVLVIGNSLPHKDVRQTVESLASAFPFQPIRALGPADAGAGVTALHSGTLSDQSVHELYANAKFVVFPSFYEGFGFPILTALAYGRTVFARRSALLEEVAARCDGRGQLIAFDRREELVELVGRLLHGEPVEAYPLNLGRQAGKPRVWADVGRDTLDFLESLAGAPSARRWIAREHVIQQLIAYRCSG